MLDTSGTGQYSWCYSFENDGIKFSLYGSDEMIYALRVDEVLLPEGKELEGGGRYPNQSGLAVLGALLLADNAWVTLEHLTRVLPKRTRIHGNEDPEGAIKTQIHYLRKALHDIEKMLIQRRDKTDTDPTAYRFSGKSEKTILKQHKEPEISSRQNSFPKSAAQFENPSGTVWLGSAFYIERRCDHLALETTQYDGFTMVIKGPRQVGKSSLLVRIGEEANKLRRNPVYLDFQTFDQEDFEDSGRFLSRFCAAISHNLNMGWVEPSATHEQLGWKRACELHIKEIIDRLDGSLTLLLDEVDRILTSNFSSDFFGMLRSWHNARANDRILRRLNLAIVTSTEPQLFISNPKESPFNVADPKIEPGDFSFNELVELSGRFETAAASPHLGAIHELLAGHPFLTRLCLHLIASGRYTFDEIQEKSAFKNGPFADHLDRLLLLLTRKETLPLQQVFLQIIKNNKASNEEALARLKGAGLIVERSGRAVPRCRLYADYFARYLNAK